MECLYLPRWAEPREGQCPRGAPRDEWVGSNDLPRQGYRLTFGEEGIRIEAADEAGLCYARQTLDQLLADATDDWLPCRVMEDWPDFARRGYLLDISRDRVPTMAQLCELVDLLAALRYNELQLYTEHTFAYAAHPLIWAEASPMTAAEILKLDAYCVERGIELVPNQNSFGHMERWLCHPAYHYLAECPGGFAHPLGGWRAQGSVLRPEPVSLEFLDGLYRELLPNFCSRRFNIGGDEPWELGQGASRERVAAEGKHAVYLDFLAQVCRLAEAHGASPLCWADVLLETPEAIDQLPGGITPILWGYEADHPFESQCATLASLGRPFYVAPGDSTWCSHTGRAATMTANLGAAAEAGLRYGAEGFLLTHWGDGGHPQPWVVALPALVRGGVTAWNRKNAESCFEPALRAVLGESSDPATLAGRLIASGGLDAALGCPLRNRSYLAHSLHLSDDALPCFEPRPSDAALRKQIRDCEDLMDPGAPEGALEAELALALRMNRFAAYRCLGGLGEVPEGPTELIRDYRKLWRRRSREGGLEASLSRMPGLLVGA